MSYSNEYSQDYNPNPRYPDLPPSRFFDQIHKNSRKPAKNIQVPHLQNKIAVIMLGTDDAIGEIQGIVSIFFLIFISESFYKI